MKNSPRVLIELRPSGIHHGGVGVFAVTKIKKGERIGEGIATSDYENLIRWSTFKTFSKDIKRKVMDFCVGTPDGFIPPEGMDFNKLSIEWYFNHSCEGNIGFNNTGNFVAIRNIKKGEELAYDYGLAESNPRFRMICQCKSKQCRKVITGTDWKKDDFKNRNRQFMLPILRGT